MGRWPTLPRVSVLGPPSARSDAPRVQGENRAHVSSLTAICGETYSFPTCWQGTDSAGNHSCRCGKDCRGEAISQPQASADGTTEHLSPQPPPRFEGELVSLGTEAEGTGMLGARIFVAVATSNPKLLFFQASGQAGLLTSENHFLLGVLTMDPGTSCRRGKLYHLVILQASDCLPALCNGLGLLF